MIVDLCTERVTSSYTMREEVFVSAVSVCCTVLLGTLPASSLETLPLPCAHDACHGGASAREGTLARWELCTRSGSRHGDGNRNSHAITAKLSTRTLSWTRAGCSLRRTAAHGSALRSASQKRLCDRSSRAFFFSSTQHARCSPLPWGSLIHRERKKVTNPSGQHCKKVGVLFSHTSSHCID